MTESSPKTEDRGGRRRRTALGVSLAMLAALLILGTALIVRQGAMGGPPGAEATPGQTPTALQIEEILRSADVYLRQGEYGKAETILRSAVRKAEVDQDLRLAYAEALLGLGDHEAAHEQFVAAIAIGPDAPEIRFDAAAVASAAGLTTDAEEHYWQAQALDPTDPRYPLYLAQVQRKLGKTSEAKKNLLLAAKLDPSLDIAWGVLADLALEENNLSIARTHLSRAREINPASLQWRILEARIERRANDPERALAILMGLSPQERAAQPMALREMALALGLMNRPLEAAELYADAATVAPAERTPELLRLAAEWYERAGRLDEAIVYASRAARLGDGPSGALLDRLERAVRPGARSGTDPDGAAASDGETG